MTFGTRFASAAIIVMGAMAAQQGAQPKLTPAEEKESYAVYSAVLRIKEPRATSWVIERRTLGIHMCLVPEEGREPIYRTTFADYAAKNEAKFDLKRKFDLPDYTLIEPGTGRSSAKQLFAMFSAVGFNSDRTRASVCFWAGSSGTCYPLVRTDGRWRLDPEWGRSGCGWAA